MLKIIWTVHCIAIKSCCDSETEKPSIFQISLFSEIFGQNDEVNNFTMFITLSMVYVLTWIHFGAFNINVRFLHILISIALNTIDHIDGFDVFFFFNFVFNLIYCFIYLILFVIFVGNQRILNFNIRSIHQQKNE